jgi:GNAT superfamily N-acetyltransferase
MVVGSAVHIREAGQPGDLGWVIMAHGEIYAREFGLDTRFEALVARIVADYAGAHDPAREAGWVAELDGRRVGCVFCVARDETTAQLRILLVDPAARGRGTGRQLVDECIRFARGAGYRRVVLWTNEPLKSAARIYRAAGFRLTAEEPHHSFGVDLVGQDYELDLTAAPPAGGTAQPVPAGSSAQPVRSRSTKAPTHGPDETYREPRDADVGG